MLALIALTMSVSASSIRYFTFSQAQRTIRHLDAQTELMIYCGYEDEIETYVLVNEVWAEKVNSQFYEIWLYGFDAYTGDEIYMPLDLGCVWLYNATGTRMYSAATTLRFRNARPLPTFRWVMPPYRPFQRRFHAPGFLYTYHYDIHQPGWHHPYTGHNPYNYPPYYMRHRSEPIPVHRDPYTPGVEMPRTMTPDGHGYLGNTRGSNPTTTMGNPSQRATSSTASTRRTTGNTADPNTILTERSASAPRGTSTQTTTTGSRSSSATTTTGRGTSTQSSNTGSRSSSTSTSTTTGRGTSTQSSNTGSRSSSSTTTTTTPRGTTTQTSNSGTRSSSSSSQATKTTTTTTTRGTSQSTGTTTRGTSSSTTTSSSTRSARSSSTSSRNPSSSRR
ncbi:MAG: hypothetical protein K5867_07890 [Bacteroidales bacterium]|nr:hypothetical protein [Bacteroidales bacterium]